ncbi:hypothetical protein ON010_g14895 [Phytophthora cinnamomi]|nr:hypothetical protein ON010_g14895 [Phytophthora cinnamomi]
MVPFRLHRPGSLPTEATTHLRTLRRPRRSASEISIPGTVRDRADSTMSQRKRERNTRLATSDSRNLRERVKVDTIRRIRKRIVDMALNGSRSLLVIPCPNDTSMRPGRREKNAVTLTSGLKTHHEKILLVIMIPHWRRERIVDMAIISAPKNLLESSIWWRDRQPVKKKNDIMKESDHAHAHDRSGMEGVAHGTDLTLDRRRVLDQGRTLCPHRARPLCLHHLQATHTAAVVEITLNATTAMKAERWKQRRLIHASSAHAHAAAQDRDQDQDHCLRHHRPSAIVDARLI